MKPVILSVNVAAPPARVWSIVTDIENATTNLPAIKRLEFIGPARQGPGTRWRETRVCFGREVTEELVISEWRPPHEYVVTTQHRGSANRCAVRVRAVGTGAQLEYEFSITAHTLVARVASTLMLPFIEKAIRKALSDDLDALKQRCESHP